jgi:hypothetical protein
MVDMGPYREYLRTVTDQKGVSAWIVVNGAATILIFSFLFLQMDTCSGLAALDYANMTFSHRYSTTSVGMGVCAHHEFVQANGVGDLQKGER